MCIYICSKYAQESRLTLMHDECQVLCWLRVLMVVYTCVKSWMPTSKRS